MPVDSRVTLALVATGDRAVCATLLLFLLPVIFFRSDFFTRLESDNVLVGFLPSVGRDHCRRFMKGILLALWLAPTSR